MDDLTVIKATYKGWFYGWEYICVDEFGLEDSFVEGELEC